MFASDSSSDSSSTTSDSTTKKLKKHRPQPPKDNTTRVEYKCFTTNKRFECHFTWTIQHFMLYTNKYERSVLKSPTFTASENSYKWFLELITPTDNHTDTELYLKISQPELEKLGPISGELRCSLIYPDGHLGKTIKGNFYLDSMYSAYGFGKFLHRHELFEDRKLFNSEDELTIFCEVSYLHQNDVNHYTDRNIWCSPRQSTQNQNLEYLLNKDLFSDVTIHLGDKKYPGHRIVLASKSEVFRAMLTHDMKEKQQNRIEIDDIDEKTFQEVLRYIYTGKVENLETVAFELVAAADKYDLAELKTICEDALSRVLELETVVKLLSLSLTHNLKALQFRIFEFIKKNWKKMANAEAWEDLKSRPDLMTVMFEIAMGSP